MATSKLYLDKRRSTKDGKFPVKIMIYHDKTVLIPTQFYASEIEWDDNQFSKKADNYRARNMKLRDLMNMVENAIFDLEDKGKLQRLTSSKLKSIIEGKLSGKPDELRFIDYIGRFMETKIKQGTREIYDITRKKVEQFDSSATFSTIDPEWLLKFENSMIKEGLKTNYIAIQLRNIRAVFNYCIDNEYTNLYPFRRFKIKTQKTAKRSLSVDDMIKLRDYPCETHQVIYRDLFMLIFYLIGINPIDLFNLKEIKADRIEYYRAKTGKRYSIKVEPEALEIIEKYRGKKYLLDVLERYSNYKDFSHRMNHNLKQIGEVERKGLGGRKSRTPLFPDITIYHARHTWATIASKLEIPKETISAALGHSIGSDVTEIYIDFDMTKVDDANRKVIDYLNIAKV